MSDATRAIVIRVHDPLALAVTQGGAIGSLASTLAPQTVESMVFSRMANQLGSSLQSNGVHADVSVVDASTLAGAAPAPPASDGRSLLWGVAIGAGGMLGLALLYHAFFGGK